MSYTETPWEVVKLSPEGNVIRQKTGARVSCVVAVGQSDEDARRIVLCVNYCAGEPDASLELFTAKEQVDLKVKFFNEANTYRDLCGELLFALTLHQQVTRPIDLSTKVIAKAEAVIGEKS